MQLLATEAVSLCASCSVFGKEQYLSVFYSEPCFASALDMVFPHRIPIYFGSNAIYKISWIYYHYLLDINCPDITTATFVLLQAEYFNYCLVFRSPRKPSWPRRRGA